MVTLRMAIIGIITGTIPVDTVTAFSTQAIIRITDMTGPDPF
jgi:hypothetical protein